MTVKHTKTCLVRYALPPPPQKHSVVRAQHSVASVMPVMHHFSVVGRSRSKDLLIGRLTILVHYIAEAKYSQLFIIFIEKFKT